MTREELLDKMIDAFYGYRAEWRDVCRDQMADALDVAVEELLAHPGLIQQLKERK